MTIREKATNWLLKIIKVDPIKQVEEEKPANPGQLRPQKPQVRGVKRTVIIGVCCIFIVAFLFAFYMQAGKRHAPTSEQNSSTQEKSVGAYANPANSSYADTLENQRKRQLQNPNQNSQNQVIGQNGNNNISSGQQRPQYVPSSPPSIAPYNPPNYSMYMPPQMPGAVQPQNQEKPNPVDYITSAIKFSISGNESSDNNRKNSNSLSGGYGNPQYVIHAGNIIPATLISGINSDLSGQVIAQVRENVYDSVSGNYLLIPQGSRLLGKYAGGSVSQGAQRIGVVWYRMIMPNGEYIQLGNMEAVDGAGYSGLSDRVNNHEGNLSRTILLSSILSAGAQIASGNTSSSNNQSTGQLAISGAATNLMNAGAQMIGRDLEIKPTIQISPGFLFNVMVNDDLTLKAWNG